MLDWGIVLEGPKEVSRVALVRPHSLSQAQLAGRQGAVYSLLHSAVYLGWVWGVEGQDSCVVPWCLYT